MNKWIANSSEEGVRLLTFLRQKFGSEFTTKNLRWAIEHHRCRVNGYVERFCSKRLKKGDAIEISVIPQPQFAFDSSRLLFENDHLLIYNKPAGISSEDLVEAFKLLLVHRLDRDTTGALLLAKTPSTQREIEQLFHDRKMEKCYVTIVKGKIAEPEGTIEKSIVKMGEKEGEGKWGVVHKGMGSYAKTEWRLERVSKNYSFVRCWPLTGRTHQIRVHFSSIGHPVLGDLRYGDRSSQGFQPFRPLLHAKTLTFTLPHTNEKISIDTPLPEDFIEGLRICFG